MRKSLPAWMVPSVVAALTFVAFLPTLRSDFVSWDDDSNFLNNPNYRGLGWRQLKWMWTTFHLGHYVPLSWMTLGLDYTLWGMNPAGYHFVNLLLHVANAVLLYFVALRLLRLTSSAPSESAGRRLEALAAFAALFFAVHPLRVESVAWVTERRDMLSLLFYLVSILLYLRYAERREIHRRWYWLALVAFVGALLSKGIAVTLPAVLLILDVYPLKRLGGQAGWWSDAARRVYVELIPFALLSAATSVLSIVALHPGKQLSVGAKLAVSAYSLSFYLWKTLVPLSLSPLYEMPKTVNPLAPRFVVSYGVVLGLTGLAWALRRRWPGVLAAWLAFLVIILPMLGVVQNGPQISADRYTYHAGPALAILVGAGLSLVKAPLTPILAGIGTAVLLTLGALTWNQTRVWHDSEHLWSRVLLLNERSSRAQTALANVLFKEDRLDEAIEHYRRSIALDPTSLEVDNNLGITLARQGKFAEAIEHYKRALSITPTHYEAHNNWGAALAQLGDLNRAIEHYRQALAIKPDYADAQINWGNALVRLGKPGEAIVHYQEAVRIRPDAADAHFNWGVALAQQGQFADAIEHFQRTLAIEPSHTQARDYLDLASRLQQQQQKRSALAPESP